MNTSKLCKLDAVNPRCVNCEIFNDCIASSDQINRLISKLRFEKYMSENIDHIWISE